MRHQCARQYQDTRFARTDQWLPCVSKSVLARAHGRALEAEELTRQRRLWVMARADAWVARLTALDGSQGGAR